VGCTDLPQLAESMPVALPLARFGKIVSAASKQRGGASAYGAAAPLRSFNRSAPDEGKVTEILGELRTRKAGASAL
jgi:hypothetical protein